MSVLSFENVTKTFGRESGSPIVALHSLSFDIEQGERVAIVGRSGSGKSTLLHLAAGIERPSEGRVRVFRRDLAELEDAERARVRRDSIGLVFQFFHLLPHLSVLENVVLPERIAGGDLRVARARAHELLGRVGLDSRARDPIDGLSGGEQQRVALCRALLRKPPIVLADEPTGSLDDASGKLVSDLLFALSSESGTTLVLVTHSRELAALADRSLELKSGEIAPG